MMKNNNNRPTWLLRQVMTWTWENTDPRLLLGLRVWPLHNSRECWPSLTCACLEDGTWNNINTVENKTIRFTMIFEENGHHRTALFLERTTPTRTRQSRWILHLKFVKLVLYLSTVPGVPPVDPGRDESCLFGEGVLLTVPGVRIVWQFWMFE